MQLTGISMNIMTLGGLAVAVGRVVDDAIVVLENIYRHRAKGDDRLTAVLTGAREVSGAITASTATTVMVFLPLGFVGGLVSQFFLPFALTVTFALLASLVCALTVVPVLAYFLVDRVKMDVDEDGEPRRSIWIRIYTPDRSAGRFSSRISPAGRSSALPARLFFASFALLPVHPDPVHQLRRREDPVRLDPAASRHQLDWRPRAHRRGRVRSSTRTRESSTSSRPFPAKATPAPSRSPPRSSVAPRTARRSSSGSTRRSTQGHHRADRRRPRRDRGSGWDIAVSEASGFSGGGINVIVSSSDRAAVAKRARRSSPRSSRTRTSSTSRATSPPPLRPSRSQVDPNKALGAGLTTAQVAGELRNVLVPSRATRIQIDDQPALDVYVQADPASVTRSRAARRCPSGPARPCRSARSPSVETVEAQGSITRIDEQPASSISAEITSDDTGAVSLAVKAEAVDSRPRTGRSRPTSR